MEMCGYGLRPGAGEGRPFPQKQAPDAPSWAFVFFVDHHV